MALLLGGKKENFNSGYFDHLGNVLNLNEKQIQGVYKRIWKWLPESIQLIDSSFLDAGRQKEYKDQIIERVLLFTTD